MELSTVVIPREATETVRRGLVLELVEQARCVLAEAKILREDESGLQVRNVREHTEELVRIAKLLESFGGE